VTQFNNFQPEQNSKKELVEAFKIAQEEYRALDKKNTVIRELLKDAQSFLSCSERAQYLLYIKIDMALKGVKN